MREAGWTLVFEDYIGTGIAWGVKTGVSRDLLLELNQHLAAVDIPILLDGQRFLESREENHIFETNDALTDQARSIHLDLAKEFSWPIVAANQPLETVEAQIWDIVHKRIFAK
jgi:thymidylate kinase